MGNFKFGVSLRSIEGREEWIAKCRKAEEIGYDVITVPDHLGAVSPFPALAVAAAVTERVRVGPLVMNVPFYNPALLARDIANIVRLSGGRFDLGVGAGHMKREFDDAGLPFRRAAERIAFTANAVAEIQGRLDDEGVEQPPLLIAGNSDGVLELAAMHADIVGFAGLRQKRGEAPGTFQIDGAEAMDERVAYFRKHAGPRAVDVEFNMLVQRVRITADRRAAAAEFAAELNQPELDLDDLLDAPQLLFGTVVEIVDQLQSRRERYGFSYISVFEAELAKFAPIVQALTDQ
jgi:probable F420-dependent oxidoreductase